MTYLLLLIGFVLLIKGADWLVQGASSIAKRLGVPSLLVGLTIVALGTSAPEVAVSVTGALKGANGLTVGNVLGSNLFNLAVVAGLLAIIRPLKFNDDLLSVGLPFGLISMVMMWGMSFNQMFSRFEGLILLGVMITYLLYLILPTFKKETPSEESVNDTTTSEETPLLSWPLAILFVIIGLTGVLVGGDWVVEQATTLATAWGWSDQLIGLTIVAIGTSLPELVTSLMAVKKGEVELALGNVFGSNILNILFVLGASSFISPISMTGTTALDLIVTLLITIFVGVIGYAKQQLIRWQGIVLVGSYFFYLAYSLLTSI